MKTKGAVFDMDGLMFDTENLTYKLQREILLKENKSFSLEDYKNTVGKRSADLPEYFKNLYGDNFSYEDFHQKCRESFMRYTEEHGVPIKDGLFEILDELKSRKTKIALATSTTRRSAERALKIAKVFDYFDALICAEDVENGKPSPEPFLKAAEKLGLEPESCIALEDSINGIKSAYSAGMVTIMVPDLIEPTDETKEKSAFIFKSLSEVKLIFQEDSYEEN